VNRILFTALVLAGVLIVWFVAGQLAASRAREVKAKVAGWDDWDLERRAACHKELILDLIDDAARRWQAFITFTLSVIIIGTMSLISLQDNTNDISAITLRNCNTAAEFRELVGQRVTAEIRQEQQHRDALADAMANSTNLESSPGFRSLSPEIQSFVRDLHAESTARNQAQLAAYDEELARLRSEADAVRTFNNNVDCPG
jgi:hypothetical protein